MQEALRTHSAGVYLILFAIVFCETGLVVTPFLPGDSLLFLAGVYASRGHANVFILFCVFVAAALSGDNVNYWFGRLLGPRVFKRDDSRFFKKANLERTHAFFERYGGKTVILARFVPIVRTFAPFVAGMGKMTYKHFLAFSVVGASIWVGVFVFGGYVFAGSAWIEKHMMLAALVVVLLSMLPGIFEFRRHWMEGRRAKAAALKAKEPAPSVPAGDGLRR